MLLLQLLLYKGFLISPDWPRTCYIAEKDLELLIFLPLPSKCRGVTGVGDFVIVKQVFWGRARKENLLAKEIAFPQKVFYITSGERMRLLFYSFCGAVGRDLPAFLLFLVFLGDLAFKRRAIGCSYQKVWKTLRRNK